MGGLGGETGGVSWGGRGGEEDAYHVVMLMVDEL